jgi:hypothetical protein
LYMSVRSLEYRFDGSRGTGELMTGYSRAQQ